MTTSEGAEENLVGLWFGIERFLRCSILFRRIGCNIPDEVTIEAKCGLQGSFGGDSQVGRQKGLDGKVEHVRRYRVPSSSFELVELNDGRWRTARRKDVSHDSSSGSGATANGQCLPPIMVVAYLPVVA